MDKVINELKFKAKLSEAVNYFYDIYKNSEQRISTKQQFTVDFINLMNCDTTKEIDEYKNINQKLIYDPSICYEI